MKDVTFEDMKKLEYGDQVILVKDPISQLAGKEIREPYVYITKFSWGSYVFKCSNGASLSIQDDETIKSFGVKLLEKTDPEWNKELSEQAKELGNFLDALEKNFIEEGNGKNG